MPIFTSTNKKLLVTFLFGNLSAWTILWKLGTWHRLDIENAEDSINILKVEESTNPSNRVDFNALESWSKSIASLKMEDKKRIETLFRNSSTSDEIRSQFYGIFNMPLQSVCTVGKFFGGQWLGGCGALDGNKYVCLDQLYRDVQTGNCLIYSFGIAGDWTFEEAMSNMGCTIRAFDPTTNENSKPASNLITFLKTGLKEYSGTASGLGPVLTLKDAINQLGDRGKKISYLKVDVEGAELKAIPEWISSGVLDQVTQIGIELHTGKGAFPKDKIFSELSYLLNEMRKLHNLGFRLISTTNNDCVGKSDDFNNVFANYFEIVLYKAI